MSEQTREERDPGALRVAFLAMRDSADGQGYYGGVLVADALGKPLEFRCTTEAVRPTKVQRTLYGESLLPCIATELIGAPLLQAVQVRPEVVLVPDQMLLELRPATTYPVLLVERYGEAFEVTDAVEEEAAASEALLRSPQSRFQPVVLRAHPRYAADASEWRGRLAEAFGRMDLMEPFERVKTALEQLEGEREV